MKQTRLISRGIQFLAAGSVLWWVGVTWVVPMLIRMTHAGKLSLLSRWMPGRGTAPLDKYLTAWEPSAINSTVVVITASLIVMAALRLWQHALRPTAGDPAPRPASDGDLMIIAAWIGVLTGLGEAYYIVQRVFYQRQPVPNFLNASEHAVWMSPLANLLTFASVGLGLVLLRRLVGSRLEPRLVLMALTWLGLFGVAMATSRVHWGAAAVLALGIAVQVGRITSPGAGETALLARRSMAWLVGLVVLLGAGVPALEALRERRQLAMADAPATATPNVLFVVLDTERAASTSLHNPTLTTTPFLERLAKQGVQFEWGLSPASWTLPSHAAMFTGHRAFELGVGYTVPLPDTYPTIATVLSRRGYATAGFVSNQYFGSVLFGLDQGFGRWEDTPVMPSIIVAHSWIGRSLTVLVRKQLGEHQELRGKTAEAVNTSFLRWLDRREQRPFLAFLNFMDAHAPYLPPAPYNLRYSATQPMYWLRKGAEASAYSSADRAELHTAYTSGIAYLDEQLADLFASLEDRDLLKNTIVVVTSDHGEGFGEHGDMGHGNDLTMPMIHVPAIIVYPPVVPAGVKVSSPVGLRHLAQTILSMTGGEDPEVAGESLERYWREGEKGPSRGESFALQGSLASLVTESFHLLRKADGSERLYNYRNDPLELHDLSGDPTLTGVRDSLRKQLQGLEATHNGKR